MRYSSRDDRKTKTNVDEENGRNFTRRSSQLSDFVVDRGRRRSYRENDSLSGSRTRSSSRTTSGNPDSSRSRSSSPSLEKSGEKEESNKPNYRKRRFLQRWDDDFVDDTSCPVDQPNNTKSESNELPYIYQQPEFIRITQDIIRKCDAEDVLVEFLRALDENQSYDLSKISDQQLKKKLRHLSKALYLERNNSEFKKPPECKISLFEVYNELSPFIKTKINSQEPYQRKVQSSDNEPEKRKLHDDSKWKLTAEEASELMSLREMHEQGFFVDYENIQKEFIKKQKTAELWGKTPEEQRKLLASDNEPEEQPWRVFDREKDLLGASKTNASDYRNLLNSANDFKESFKVVTKSTSFM
ncbi:conserved hypothetical protein [Theileria orientalis strain Shintoku]|uniref:DUF3752 domain-containing protein n=1 Tax=Theileria orientalis strain Shintoku TaxID=869250 RepID=J4C4I3_THEOR|nr:conserved hypothetical protein [Theileria orientalis strain Shintoku]PVC51466.1 hypothetical protein MACL_00001543 [Theileria orientalis]BAM42236.1 conserved hypothetical protein [Theileria orientalis strain Shintoku]|eukprot:XP_009692537.1 conserved hypothetical protein [Theileria orientalis strain Shintoku]